MFILAGIFFLGLGGDLAITHGVKLAGVLNVSPTIIGMAVIAIGTSLPEFVTSIIAAMRKEADLCVGNVIGSNIFNILLVLPVSMLVNPIEVSSDAWMYVVVMFSITLLAWFLTMDKRIKPMEGSVLVGLYILFLVWVSVF